MDDVKTDGQKAVESLIKRAAEATSPQDALALSQAAANCAAALADLNAALAQSNSQ